MSQGRIYEIEGDELCPVKAFEVYLAFLNPDIEWLWQKPNPHYLATGKWYCRQPLGKNSLGKMMANMCKAANLTNRYTNHCTRVTAAVLLNEGGFNENDICKVTGHASTSSLKSYNHRATTSKKREMSDSINNQMFSKCKKNVKENVPPPQMSENVPIIQCDELEELTDDQMVCHLDNYEDNLFDYRGQRVFRDCVFNQLPASHPPL